MLDEVRSGRAVARDDVDDPWRQLCLPADVGEDQGRQRSRLGRLQHDRVAAGKRRGDLPGQHQERKVPRDDLAGNTERTGLAVGKCVLELVGPAGVVEEMRRCQRDVDVPRLLDRLATVERLRYGELARALLDQAGDPEEVLRTLARPQRRPAALEGTARRLDCEVDVPWPRERDLSEVLLGRRGDRRKPLPRAGRELLASDEEAVALLERDDVPRLRGRGVLPLERRGNMACSRCLHRATPDAGDQPKPVTTAASRACANIVALSHERRPKTALVALSHLCPGGAAASRSSDFGGENGDGISRS